jgi:transcriptional regulator of arginine metabolism
MMNTAKERRQDIILRLIGGERIHTQEQLAGRLREMGIEATQVTLSRDIRELQLLKGAQGYQQVESLRPMPPADDVLQAAVTGHLLEVRTAQNLVVLKTSPGHAQAIAVALDREPWPELVGTIAGDDTILVVTPDTSAGVALRDRLLAIIGRGERRGAAGPEGGGPDQTRR